MVITEDTIIFLTCANKLLPAAYYGLFPLAETDTDTGKNWFVQNSVEVFTT